MKKEGYLTISEFSEIAEVSRKTLIFYDNIGLFSPEYTAETVTGIIRMSRFTLSSSSIF